MPKIYPFNLNKTQMKKILLSAGLFCMAIAAQAQCEAQAELNENFNDFTDLPENCWSAITTGTMVYIDGEETEQYVSFYSLMSANVPGYLITPELSTLGGNYTLSFDAGLQEGTGAGNATIQLGTLTDPADATTFTAVGEAITLTSEIISYTDIAIPGDAGNHIAFMITADGQHIAAAIDNVKWDTTAGIAEHSAASFGLYPNPSVDGNITLNLNSAVTGKGLVSVFSLTGAKVFETAIAAGISSQQISLSSLSAGMYIVKVEAGSYTQSKKLVIR